MLARALIITLALAAPFKLWAAEHKTAAWACYAPDKTPGSEQAFGANADRLITLYEVEVCDGEQPAESTPSCRVTYEKKGNIETLWNAKVDSNYCRPHALALANKLEQAGLSCTTADAEPACPQKLSKAPEPQAQHAQPPSSSVIDKKSLDSHQVEHDENHEADAYINLVRAYAATGDLRFQRELKWLTTPKGDDQATAANGVFNDSSYRENWEDLKTTAVIRDDAHVWIVQSAYCVQDACASVVVQPVPSADNFSELRLVGVFAGQPDLQFIHCISAVGARACWRDESNRPIYHVQDARGQTSIRSLYTYDDETNAYTTYLTCHQSKSNVEQAYAYQLYSPLHPGEILDSGQSEYEQLCEGVMLNVLLHNATDSFDRGAQFATSMGTDNQLADARWSDHSIAR